MSDAAFPTRVSFTAEDVARDSSEERLADKAVVQIVIDKVYYKTVPTQGKGPGEDLKQSCKCSIIDPENGQKRMGRLQIWVGNTLPIKHPDFLDTHVPPNWSKGMWEQFLQGFVPERHFSAPRMDKGKLMFNGKAIKQEDVAEINVERSKARLQEAETLCATKGDDLLKRTCFATIKISEGDGGRVFVNANNLRPELYEKEELTPKDELVVSVDTGGNVIAEEPTNGKKNGKAGRAKAAKASKSRRKKKN